MQKKIFLAVVCVFVVVVGLLITNQISQAAGKDDKGNAAPTKPAKLTTPARPSPTRTSNISINGTGKVQLSGVRVSAVWGNQITATSTIGGKPVTVTINTNSDTKINPVKSGKLATSTGLTKNSTNNTEADKVVVGSLLSVTGTLQELSPQLTILAQEMRVTNVRQAPPRAERVTRPATTSPSLINRLFNIF